MTVPVPFADQDRVPALRPLTVGGRRLNHARAFVRRFWVPTSEAALDLVMLWAAGTHMTDGELRMVFANYPHLFFGSKLPQSGKSTIIRLLAGTLSGEQDGLCARGEWFADPSAPAMRSMLHAEKAALCIDEIDVKQGGGAFPNEMLAIINASYDRGGVVIRGGTGETGNAKRFHVYGPICMGGMYQRWMSAGDLKAARDRTYLIPCAPPASGVEPESFYARDHGPDLKGHGDALGKWAADVTHEVEAYRMSDEDKAEWKGRPRQLAEPILAIAEAAGGDWPERARNALRVIARGFADEFGEPEPANTFEYLLRDLGRVWSEGEETLWTREIVARLQALPNTGWDRFDSPEACGKELAQILFVEDVVPKSIRKGDEVRRGYTLADLVRIGMRPSPVPVDLEAIDF